MFKDRRVEERRFLFCSIGGNRIRDGGRERKENQREEEGFPGGETACRALLAGPRSTVRVRVDLT
jgi:hypothetical protein